MKAKFVAASIVMALASVLSAQGTRVNVVIENLAPNQGVFHTPVWVGFHNGTFDVYDGGALANTLPIPGSDALERLAEDGNTGPITRDFSLVGGGRVQDTIAGPNGPIAPGDRIVRTFTLDPLSPLDRYFSYASMIIPSNDAFVANGNPFAHKIFDAQGNFVAQDFFVSGNPLDAGTEVNDEIPANTAFFGQQAPDTGVTESVVIGPHPGFNPFGSGGILDDPRFRNGDITLPGFPFLRFGFRAAPAINDFRSYAAILTGAEEVPARNTPAIGVTSVSYNGSEVVFNIITLGLENLIFGHLHLGLPGVNGPVVATLVPNRGPGSGGGGFQVFAGTLSSADLTGPLADFPVDELVRRIENGEIYVNLHTDDGLPGANTGPGDFIGGEIRGQLQAF